LTNQPPGFVGFVCALNPPLRWRPGGVFLTWRDLVDRTRSSPHSRRPGMQHWLEASWEAAATRAGAEGGPLCPSGKFPTVRRQRVLAGSFKSSSQPRDTFSTSSRSPRPSNVIPADLPICTMSALAGFCNWLFGSNLRFARLFFFFAQPPIGFNHVVLAYLKGGGQPISPISSLVFSARDLAYSFLSAERASLGS